MTNNTPHDQLNEAAEKYASEFYAQHRSMRKLSFKAGALSPEAANGCNKHVEKAKIEFAIECLRKVTQSQLPTNEALEIIYELIRKIDE